MMTSYRGAENVASFCREIQFVMIVSFQFVMIVS